MASIISQSPSANNYTRNALLGWANAALSTNYSSLDDIPAKDVALLLNAMNGHANFPLNKIEFRDANVPEAQRRNCQVVVAQSASHLGYEGRLSAQLWFAKEDAANELLFWRWIRQSAEAKGWNGKINVATLQGDSASMVTEDFSVSPDGAPSARRPPRYEIHAADYSNHNTTLPTVPLSRDADAFHTSASQLQSHLLTTSNGVVSGMECPHDPYIAAILDAKKDKLRRLQSLRSRLITACHNKDRTKVMELMCEYHRGGTSADSQVAGYPPFS